MSVSEILPTNAHIHMNALTLTCEAVLLTPTTFCFSFVAFLFYKDDKIKGQVQGFEGGIRSGANANVTPALLCLILFSEEIIALLHCL